MQERADRCRRDHRGRQPAVQRHHGRFDRTAEDHQQKQHAKHAALRQRLAGRFRKEAAGGKVSQQEVRKHLDTVCDDNGHMDIARVEHGSRRNTTLWASASNAIGQPGDGPSDRPSLTVYGSVNADPAVGSVSLTAGGRVFGSGWVFVTVAKDGKLAIVTKPNQDTPIMDGQRVLFGNDVWEHAYYLKYQNRRPEYIGAWWEVVNWDEAERRYQAARSA